MAFPFDVLSWLVRARYKLTPPAATDGETIELQATVNGALKVSMDPSAPAGVVAVRQLTAASTGALKAAGVGSLIEVTLWNSGAVALWFQVHDKSGDVSPGDTCVDQVLIPAGGALGWRPAVPVAASTRLRWAASTTPGTYTAPGVAACGFSAGVL